MKGKWTKIIFPIFSIVVLVLQAALFMKEEDVQYKNYLRAARLEEKGNFDEAIELLTELKEYKDAEERKMDVSYLQAVQFMEEGDYEQAIPIFRNKLSLYDSKDRMIMCRYKLGTIEMEAKNYEIAANHFKNAVNFEDANEKWKECEYLRAMECIEDGSIENLETAEKLLADIGDYQEAQSFLSDIRYQIGIYYKEQGNYEKEVLYFESILGYKDSKELLYKDQYQYAASLMEAEKYEEAREMYAELAKVSYQDSALLEKECIYQDAVSKMDAFSISPEKGEELLKKFEYLGDYKDSSTYVTECKKIAAYGSGRYVKYDKILTIKNVQAYISGDGELYLSCIIKNNTGYRWEEIRFERRLWYSGTGVMKSGSGWDDWEKITLEPGENYVYEKSIGGFSNSSGREFKKNGYIEFLAGEGESCVEVYKEKYSTINNY